MTRKVSESFIAKMQKRLDEANTVAWAAMPLHGKVDWELGDVTFSSSKRAIKANVYLIYRCKLKEIDTDDLESVGLRNKRELENLFKKQYNAASRETEITVVRYIIKQISDVG